MIIILIKNTENKCMQGVRVFFCYARMYSGNSVRSNKTIIRWKGIFKFVLFLIYLKFHYYSVWFVTLQLCGRCMLCNHVNAIGDYSLPDYVINVVVDNY